MTRRGFSLIEMVIVLVVAALTMGVAVNSMRDYSQRTAARRAADVFARDLQIARATAIRERNTVVIDFDEAGLSYVVRTSAGRIVNTRAFGAGGEIRLQAIDLALDGDSVPFSARGIATLAGAVGSLATATFTVGSHEYEVSFSALGASEVTD
jgi:type II secretion system protein H